MAVNYQSKIVTDGLVLCLDASDKKSYPGSGTSYTDRSRNNNNGTSSGGVSYDVNNSGSLVFDGIDDRILISCNNSTIRTYNSTTQFTVKLPVYSGGQRCILSYRAGGGGSLYIGKSSNGIFCYYGELSVASYIVGNIASNETVICTVTCDATNNLLSIYINGTLIGSASRTGWVTSYHTSLYLGWDAGGTNEYMLGNFYQFSHYNRVLTPEEIQQNFNATRGRYGI
jgi:hypothetical protein